MRGVLELKIYSVPLHSLCFLIFDGLGFVLVIVVKIFVVGDVKAQI